MPLAIPVAAGLTIADIEVAFASPSAADRARKAGAALPDPVEADALAASITVLMGNGGVTLASDGGWSAAGHPTPR